MREPPHVSEERLRACLQEQYELAAVTLEFLPLGLDANAGVYRVGIAQGDAYLLKVKRGPIYDASCLVPRYLRDSGIAAVVAPLPTTQGGLWSNVGEAGEWVLTLYPFIEGVTGWAPVLTDAQWRAVGATFRRIHQISPPEGVPSLRQETFDPTAYRQGVRTMETEYACATGGSTAEQALREQWAAHRPAISTLLSTMETLAASLRERAGPHVLCHADLHPGNIIRDGAGRVFVIDWDDVMLAPKERDFLFVGDAREGGSAGTNVPPFYQGYGPVEVDWVALTYYRCERVIQDVIAFAQEVFERPDLGAEDKAESARHFGALFAPGDTVR